MWGMGNYGYTGFQRPVYNTFTYGARTTPQPYEQQQWTLRFGSTGSNTPTWGRTTPSDQLSHATTPGSLTRTVSSYDNENSMVHSGARRHSAPAAHVGIAPYYGHTVYPSLGRIGSCYSTDTYGNAPVNGANSSTTPEPPSQRTESAHDHSKYNGAHSTAAAANNYNYNANTAAQEVPANDGGTVSNDDASASNGVAYKNYQHTDYAPAQRAANGYGNYSTQPSQNAHNANAGHYQRTNSGFGMQRTSSQFANNFPRTNSSYANGGNYQPPERTSSAYGTYEAPAENSGMQKQSSFAIPNYYGYGGNAGYGSSSNFADAGLARGHSFMGAPAMQNYGSMYNLGQMGNTAGNTSGYPFARQGSFSSLSTQHSFGSLAGTGGSFMSSSFGGSSYYGNGNQSFRDGYGSFYNNNDNSESYSAGKVNGHDAQELGSSSRIGDDPVALPTKEDTQWGTGAIGVSAVDGNSNVPPEKDTSPATKETPAAAEPNAKSSMVATPTMTNVPPRMTNQDTFYQRQNYSYAQPQQNNVTQQQRQRSTVSPVSLEQPPSLSPTPPEPVHIPRHRNSTGSVSTGGQWPQTILQKQRATPPPPHDNTAAGVGFNNSMQNSINSDPVRGSRRMPRPRSAMSVGQNSVVVPESISPHVIGRNRNGGRRLTFSGEEVM